ncbi:MAG: hypothetical protein LJE85_04420 [Gammaproteobacteria bacterium]|jgi:hypothetical protein|nr:hypothetical protein [Gammaproteobacteria bacterium]
MNTFLVVDTVRLNSTNRFVLTGAIREGLVVAGMQAIHPQSNPDFGLEIMKVELVDKSSGIEPHCLAVLLRLDDVVESGLDKPELWIGKEIQCL